MIISSFSSSLLIMILMSSMVCSISGILDLYTFFDRSKLVSMYLYFEYSSLKAPRAVSTETSPRNFSTSSCLLKTRQNSETGSQMNSYKCALTINVEAGIPLGFFPSVMRDCKLISLIGWAILAEDDCELRRCTQGFLRHPFKKCTFFEIVSERYTRKGCHYTI